jgi:flagellar motor switch/type III secretory pathway protein FliN
MSRCESRSGPRIAFTSAHRSNFMQTQGRLPACTDLLPEGVERARGLMSTAAQNLDMNAGKTSGPQAVPSRIDPLDTLPWLPCILTLEVPVVRFTIADLLALKEGSIVETACHHTSDVPLRVNHLLIGWTEFEVVEDRLAVRITEQI